MVPEASDSPTNTASPQTKARRESASTLSKSTSCFALAGPASSSSPDDDQDGGTEDNLDPNVHSQNCPPPTHPTPCILSHPGSGLRSKRPPKQRPAVGKLALLLPANEGPGWERVAPAGGEQLVSILLCQEEGVPDFPPFNWPIPSACFVSGGSGGGDSPCRQHTHTHSSN